MRQPAATAPAARWAPWSGCGSSTRSSTRQGAHWLHHALFGVTAATATAAASSAGWGRRRAGRWLLPALLAWAALPRVAAPSRGHVALAACVAPCYAAAVAALREG